MTTKLIKEFRTRSKYISETKHPYLDMIIWKYNTKCQFDQVWDDYTRIARGMITDTEGNVLYRCLPKFFNLDQVPETILENLPNEIPTVYEKLDGSLITSYWDYRDLNWCGASGGSFISDQAKWATEILQELNLDLRRDYTYIWELIHPLNRIVVNYGNRKELVLLAIYDNEIEIEIEQEAERLGVTCARKISCGGIAGVIDHCKYSKADKEEGFVLKYSNGLRVKVKGADYVRVHGILNNITTLAIWEELSQGREFDIKATPDEYHDWIKKETNELWYSYNVIDSALREIVRNEIEPITGRKEQASYIVQNHKYWSYVLFGIMDGKEYSKLIWNHLRPKTINKATIF